MEHEREQGTNIESRIGWQVYETMFAELNQDDKIS
jgi:hypothetical protein